MGGIFEDNTDLFFLEIVPNRKNETLKMQFKKRILEGSILVTDKDPSYSSVARQLKLEQKIVNHTVGFVNADGEHTNSIKNM